MVAGLSITKRPMHTAQDRPASRDGGPTNLIFGRDKASSVSTGMIEMAGTCRGGPNPRDISIPSITTMSGMVVEAHLESIIWDFDSICDLRYSLRVESCELKKPARCRKRKVCFVVDLWQQCVMGRRARSASSSELTLRSSKEANVVSGLWCSK